MRIKLLERSAAATGCILVAALCAILSGCGGSSGGGGGGGGGGPTVPAAPSGLQATAGSAQVSLTWSASSGATSYNVKRATTTGGPYTTIASPATTNYTDTGLTNGTAYYYVVSAVNSAGESANSAQVSATPAAGTTSVQVTINALSNRHPISPYVYGTNFPRDSNAISNSGTTLVRWGGNAASRYNWENYDYNSANDWYFEDYAFGALNNSADSDSTQFIKDVIAAGGSPLMTMVMLDWVAKDSASTSHSFSVAKYGSQCKTDPYNADAGNGQKTDCATNITGNDPSDANVPIKDTPASGGSAGTVYRSEWAAALATAFGSAPHFYDMDNEIDIWSGTHRDVHPNPATYQELRDTYLTEARGLKIWDPQAIRFGPVSCCWYYYWNTAAGASDKSTHGNLDFLPWWLNEVYWSDLIAGARSLDVYDFHAYPDGPDTTSFTLAQKQALALRIFRDYWDPTYVTEGWFSNNNVMTTDPLYNIPFRLPRMRALANTNYPGTPVSLTEWNAAIAGESDYSTALADADAYGILGRERLYAAARWVAPDPATAAFQALTFYADYDGLHHGFGTLSVSATHTANPNLFSAYAALDATGQTLTVMAINKDPANFAQVQFALNGFNATQVTTYTLAPAANNRFLTFISTPQAWSATQSFAPYALSLLVISGSMPTKPSAEWDLNPESVMVPAGGTVTLEPKLTSGSGTVTLSSPQFDSGISSVSITGASVTTSQNGSTIVTAGTTPGFYRFTITGTDNLGLVQKQSGWIVVGNPAASLTKQGDAQTGAVGTTLNLSVTLAPGQSGGTASGASILFTTDTGSVEGNGMSGTRVIVPTDGSGQASVVLTLPSAPGMVHVTAEGPYGLGHPVVTFTETAQ